MTIDQRRTARLEMEAQRALAARLLDELENPTPISATVAAKVAAFDEEVTRNGWSTDPMTDDEAASHYAKPKGYIAIMLTSLEDDGDHLIWTGPTTLLGPTQTPSPKAPGIHALCGKAHFQAARGFKEEQLGYALDEHSENVIRTCDENLCVAADHHIVKERA